MAQDTAGFAGFYQASRDRCLRAVQASVGDRELAEDLVAEGFVRALMAWPKVSRHPAPEAWVVRTAMNTRITWWRRRSGLAGLAGTGLAVAAGVALALPAMGAGHGTPAVSAGQSTPATAASTAKLTGWTVRTEANGTVVVTVAQLNNKAELQRVLAEHGIPALVYAGAKECGVADSELALGGRAMKPSSAIIDGRSEFVLDIKPSALPRGTELLFYILIDKAGAVRGGGGAVIYDGASVTCTPAQ